MHDVKITQLYNPSGKQDLTRHIRGSVVSVITPSNAPPNPPPMQLIYHIVSQDNGGFDSNATGYAKQRN